MVSRSVTGCLPSCFVADQRPCEVQFIGVRGGRRAYDVIELVGGGCSGLLLRLFDTAAGIEVVDPVRKRGHVVARRDEECRSRGSIQ